MQKWGQKTLFTGGKGKKKEHGMSLWSVEGLKTEVYTDSVNKQKMYGKF
jgi:hypothetical protein